MPYNQITKGGGGGGRVLNLLCVTTMVCTAVELAEINFWLTLHWLSLSPLTSYWLSLSPLTLHWLSLSPLTSHWLSLSRFTLYWLSLTPHWFSLSPLTSHWLSLSPLTSHWLSQLPLTSCWLSLFPLTSYWLFSESCSHRDKQNGRTVTAGLGKVAGYRDPLHGMHLQSKPTAISTICSAVSFLVLLRS